MKVTTQQKVLLGFLAAGIVFLSYDQLHATSAPGSTDEVASVQVASASSLSMPAVAPGTLSVAGRLAALQKAIFPVRDAFATFSVPASAAPSVPASDFTSKHQLTAVILSGSQAKAMINGSLVRIGQTIDGYTLRSLDRNSAVLQSGNTTVTLQID